MTETVKAWAIERECGVDGGTYLSDVKTYGKNGVFAKSNEAAESLKYRMMYATDKLVQVTIERAKP